MGTEYKGIIAFLHAAVVFHLVGLDIWVGWMMLRSFKRETPLSSNSPSHTWRRRFGARGYFFPWLVLTGALIYQYVL